MTPRARFWNVVLVLSSAVNLAAVWFAAQPGEAWHATAHAALALGLGIWAYHRIRPVLRGESELPALTDQRLERIERAIESVAIEVERIGEMERFTSKILATRYPEAERGVITPKPLEARKNTPL